MHFEDLKYIREVNLRYFPTRTERFRINDPEDAAKFVRSILTDNVREHFVVLFLDTKHVVTSYSITGIGTADACLVHPREVFQRALLVGSSAIVIAHNHPSGDLTPSNEDWSMTKALADAGKIIGIRILDHIIVSDDSHMSMQRERPF